MHICQFKNETITLAFTCPKSPLTGSTQHDEAPKRIIAGNYAETTDSGLGSDARSGKKKRKPNLCGLCELCERQKNYLCGLEGCDVRVAGYAFRITCCGLLITVTATAFR